MAPRDPPRRQKPAGLPPPAPACAPQARLIDASERAGVAALARSGVV